QQTGREGRPPPGPARADLAQGALARPAGAHLEVEVGVQPGVADEVAAGVGVGVADGLQLAQPGLVQGAVEVVVDEVPQSGGHVAGLVHGTHLGLASRSRVRWTHSNSAWRMRRSELWTLWEDRPRLPAASWTPDDPP